MGHKCFISFKTEDLWYKHQIQEQLGEGDMIDKSLDESILSEDQDYILQKIREDYLSDSTVTIHLIGRFSAENHGIKGDQDYIKRELQGSLYNGAGNTRSGILGIVLPEMFEFVFRGSYNCPICGKSHDSVYINDETVVKEFSYNYYIPHERCSWSEDDRYCVLCKWEEFRSDPDYWIEKAFQKRTDPIAEKTRVYP